MSDTDKLIDAVPSPSTANITGSMHGAATRTYFDDAIQRVKAELHTEVHSAEIKRRKTTKWKSVAKTAQAAVAERQREIDALYVSLDAAIVGRNRARRWAVLLGIGWLALLIVEAIL
jgi:hypothetical protein